MRSIVSPCTSLVRCNTIAASTAQIVSHNIFSCARYGKHEARSYNTFAQFRTSRTKINYGIVGPSISGEIVTTNISHDISLYKSKYSSDTVSISVPPVYPSEIVFLVGAPGAGKGTHSIHISNQRNYNAPTIVVSDLLNTPSCKLLKDRGVMVDDSFVFDVLCAELQKPMYRNGVVVDGFPRTTKQADFIAQLSNEQYPFSQMNSSPRILLVLLHVDETLSIERQLERGRKLKAHNQQCVVSGQPLVEVRQTDLEFSAAKARYKVFEAQSESVQVLAQNFPLVVVDASADVHRVRNSLSEKMESFNFL
eukprot:Phypoly_transcript_12998.p1 GENE.Phypoly_transcript_12998~~Phypoly_transcript_12998.p1  ORF type:complete len:308 (+),score=25.59 Phypoly_transcript_12998:82-1005(+)